ASLDQAGVGHGLGEAPVHGDLAGRHFLAVGHDLLHSSVQLEILGEAGERLVQGADALDAHAGVGVLGPGGAHVGAPVDHGLDLVGVEDLPGDDASLVERVAVLAHQAIGLLGVDHALFHQPLGVDPAGGG